MIKSLKNIIFWGAIMIAIFSTIIVRPLSNLDEIWNFNISRCISNGLIPYKDISMITTPLTGYIGAIFLKIFGSQMFVTRILGASLAIINLALFYRITKKINIPKTITMILIICITIMLLPFFTFDYNFLSLTFILIITLLEIKKRKKNKQNRKLNNLIIGIFSGLLFCTKQSIGLITCMLVILSPFYEIASKKEIKKILKNLLFRFIGILIPISIFIGYLLISKSFGEFWSYCVSGIQTFSNKISYYKLVDSKTVYIKILSILVPITLFIAVILNILKKYLKKENYNLYILTLYSLAIFSLAFPISDVNHFVIAIIPSLIITVYLLFLGITKIKNIEKINFKYLNEFVNILSIIFIVGFVLMMEINQGEDIGDVSKYKLVNHFDNIKTTSNQKNRIDVIDNYILKSEKEVYILDACSALYMIPIDRYNKNFDMFNKGNFGKDGENKLIEELKEQEAKYLILNKAFFKNWQNPDNVTDFVKNNFKHIETIEIYDVYDNSEYILNNKSIDESKQESSSEENVNEENTNNENSEKVNNENSEEVNNENSVADNINKEESNNQEITQ